MITVSLRVQNVLLMDQPSNDPDMPARPPKPDDKVTVVFGGAMTIQAPMRFEDAPHTGDIWQFNGSPKPVLGRRIGEAST